MSMTSFDSVADLARFVLHPRSQRRQRQLACEAVAWRNCLLSADENTNAPFAEWLLRSPDHVRTWLELTAFDEEAAQALGYPALGAIVAPIESTPTRRIRATGSARRRRAALATVAATVLIALLLGLIAAQYLHVGATEYVTAIGDHRRIVLDDNSVVDLNTQSRIVVRFTPRRRVIELSGEALFDVAHDARRPIQVLAGGTVIEDAGTRFSVRSDPDRLSIVVAEGRIRVVPDHNGPEGAVELGAGEAAEIVAGTVAVTSDLNVADVSRRLSWVGGVLLFENESLRSIVAEVNRYNRRVLVIADPGIAELRLGGRFATTHPMELARALERLKLCKVVYSGNEIRLVSKDLI